MIRLMTLNDYDAVFQLWRATPGVGMRSLDDSIEGVERFLQRNPNTCFVAEELGEEIIGVILCGHDGRRGFIYHTAVKEERRCRGVGRSLVNAAMEALRKEKITKVALVAFQSNIAGNRFWEAMGFESRDDLVYRNFSLNDNNIE